MNTGWRLGRRPALDGLRGVAIALVLLCHTGAPRLAAAGPVGVTLFFVLSGFLITSLLLEELDRTGEVSLPAFYLRRARRLLPALLVSCGVVAIVGSVLGSWFFQWRNLAAVLLYAGNWVQTLGGQLNGLEGTWSLAVEEQFYLVWPVLFLLAMQIGRRWAIALTAAGIVAVLLDRAYLFGHGAGGPRLYFATDMHADALLAGCLIAFLVPAIQNAAPTRPRRGRRLVRPEQWATLALVVCAACSLIPGDAAWTTASAVATVPAAAAVCLVVSGRPDGGPRWLTAAPLLWLGRRSYGIYLWNCPAAWLLANRVDLPWPVEGLILVAFTLPVAAASWRWVERPFLSGRTLDSPADRLRRDQAGDDRGVGPRVPEQLLDRVDSSRPFDSNADTVVAR